MAKVTEPQLWLEVQGLSWWGRVGRGVGRLQGGGVWRGVLQEEGDC